MHAHVVDLAPKGDVAGRAAQRRGARGRLRGADRSRRASATSTRDLKYAAPTGPRIEQMLIADPLLLRTPDRSCGKLARRSATRRRCWQRLDRRSEERRETRGTRWITLAHPGAGASVVRVHDDITTPARDRMAIRTAAGAVRVPHRRRRARGSTSTSSPGARRRAGGISFLRAKSMLETTPICVARRTINDDTVRVELGPRRGGPRRPARVRSSPARRAASAGARARWAGERRRGIAWMRRARHGGGGPRPASRLARGAATFDGTGGLHAAALFCARWRRARRSTRTSAATTPSTSWWAGSCWAGACRCAAGMLMLSGRAGFELVQEARGGRRSDRRRRRGAVEPGDRVGRHRRHDAAQDRARGGLDVYCGSARIAGLTDIGPISRAPNESPA